jgi:hypothetical protein
MSSSISLDTLVVAGLVVSGAIYLFRESLFGNPSGSSRTVGGTNGVATNGLHGVQRKKRSRNFVQVMGETVSVI